MSLSEISLSTKSDTLTDKDQILTSVTAVSTSDHEDYLVKLHKSFDISYRDSQIIQDDLLQSFQIASKTSQISMIPTNFNLPNKIPTNSIHGKFLCIDIGGSTIRIGVVSLSTTKVIVLKQSQWILKDVDKTIDLKFFDNVVTKAFEILNGELLDVGITWSFPLDESNKIITMGKGFTISNEVKGKSIDSLISESFEKLYGLKLRINAIINDSVAVLVSGLINENSPSSIALIIGTGINACILKENELINTELGFFGKLINPTKYDSLLDSRWRNKDFIPYLNQIHERIFQPFEFLTSSRYICELIRLILQDLTKTGLLRNFDMFEHPFELHGSFISSFDEKEDFGKVQILIRKKFGLSKISLQEITLISSVIDTVLERSSKYVAFGVQALHELINDKEDDEIHVNFIGSFLHHCKAYQAKIVKNSGGRIHLNHIDNSSIIGAGVAAFLKTLN